MWQKGCSSPWLGRNLLYSGDFPERAIGNSSCFPDCSPYRLTHPGMKYKSAGGLTEAQIEDDIDTVDD